jgi:hypothetical protein
MSASALLPPPCHRQVASAIALCATTAMPLTPQHCYRQAAAAAALLPPPRRH